MSQTARTRRSLWLWTIGYFVLLIAVVGGIVQARTRTIAQMSTPQSVAEWQSWREDVRQHQSQPGPVTRRVPKSAEPPALVLMRDYFAISLAGAVLFSSLLYWIIVWFIRGILGSGQVTRVSTDP